MSTSIKSWATPLAVGAFTISAVTGILIFFDIEMGLVEPIHKWLSWLFVCAVVLHLVANWKQFTGYLSKKSALLLMGAGVATVLVSVLPIFGEEEGKENPAKMAAFALGDSSLETVALVIKTTPQALADELSRKGIIVNNPTATVEQIARSNGKNPKEVLADILALSKASEKDDEDHD